MTKKWTIVSLALVAVSLTIGLILQYAHGENIQEVKRINDTLSLQEALNEVRKGNDALNNLSNILSNTTGIDYLKPVDFNYTEILRLACNERPDLLNKTELARCEELKSKNMTQAEQEEAENNLRKLVNVTDIENNLRNLNVFNFIIPKQDLK